MALGVSASGEERISTCWTVMCKMLCRLSHWIFVISWEAGYGKASFRFIDWKREALWAYPEQAGGKQWHCFSHPCQANAPWSLSFIPSVFFECLLCARHQSTAYLGNTCFRWQRVKHSEMKNKLDKSLPFDCTRSWSRGVDPKVTELVSNSIGNRTQFILASKFIFPLLDAGSKLLPLQPG